MFVLNDTPNCGVTMTFENGLELSIQWGKANYCENRYNGENKSKDAEIAIFFGNENITNHLFKTILNDLCLANVTPDQLVDIIQIVKNY